MLQKRNENARRLSDISRYKKKHLIRCRPEKLPPRLIPPISQTTVEAAMEEKIQQIQTCNGKPFDFIVFANVWPYFTFV